MPVRTIHRWSAMVLLLFLILHIGNHLAALGGVPAHIAAMDKLRLVYRNPLAELLLLIACAVQIVTGMTRVIAGWRQRRGRVAWLQAATGLYIATFLLIHVGAVLTARSTGVDTNFYFAAAGMHVPGFIWFFVPYYGLALFSLFAHAGCAAYWAMHNRGAYQSARTMLGTMIAAGMICAATIVAVLAGWLVEVRIPASYLSAFAG